MTAYSVFFKRSARSELTRLDEPLRARVWSAIVGLTDEPRPRGCRKLKGGPGLWRLRVGDYRVVYSIDEGDREVDIIAVRHRSDAYR